MARNLRAKLAATDTLLIHDLNADATQNFINEAKTSDGATARVAGTARELAEQSVSTAAEFQSSLVIVMSMFYQ